MKLIKSNPATLAGSLLAVATLLTLASLNQPVAIAQSRAALVKPTMEVRSALATGIEDQLRQGGVDARVQLDGDQRDVLRIDWQGVKRQQIFAFVTSSTMRDTIQPAGFKAIVFASDQQQWEYNLARESMVWTPVQFKH
jgi:hypothetical protein